MPSARRGYPRRENPLEWRDPFPAVTPRTSRRRYPRSVFIGRNRHEHGNDRPDPRGGRAVRRRRLLVQPAVGALSSRDRRDLMSDHVYKTTELVGSSATSI